MNRARNDKPPDDTLGKYSMIRILGRVIRWGPASAIPFAHHFFNPVRYMRLLEIVDGPMTHPAVVSQLTEFCDQTLGKGVVACKDTPGFLGNRVGVYAIQVAIIEAIEMGLTVEEADTIMGRPIGWPKTGVFRLYDLIGLDLMLDVLENMRGIVKPDDPFYSASAEIPLIRSLVNRQRR